VTKLDVLDDLETIPVCVAYQLGTERVEMMPTWPEDIEQCKPIYEHLPGWQRPIGDCRTVSDLPPQARAYLDKIAHSRVRGPQPRTNGILPLSPTDC